MKRILPTLAALSLATPVAALAQTATAPAPEAPVVTVTDAYAWSNNPDVGAAFLTLSNAGPTDCVLAGVTAQGFGVAELHTHRDEAGVMKMVKIDSLTVPAGGSHALARGGDHVMLMQPAAPIMQGQTVAIRLDLGACGTVPVDVTIDNKAGPTMSNGMMDGAAPATHGHMHGHGMDGQTAVPPPASN